MRTLGMLWLILIVSSCRLTGQLSNSDLKERCRTDRDSMKWPLILMYHDLVATKADATARDDLPVAWFDKQLQFLKDQDYRTISMDELYELKNNPSKRAEYPDHTVLLSFDDGYAGNHPYALPRLRDKNFKASFFVHTRYVGVTTQTQGHPRGHMTWAQLNEIEQDPLFEVFSHTANHPDLTTLSPDKLRYELEEPLRKLQAELGTRNAGEARQKNPNVMGPTLSHEYLAYPYGAYNPEVVMATQKLYKMALAVAYRPQYDLNPLFSIPRMGVGLSHVENENFESTLSSWFPCR